MHTQPDTDLPMPAPAPDATTSPTVLPLPLTLHALLEMGKGWSKKPSLQYRDFERSSQTWNKYQAKCSLRLAVELAHITGVSLDSLAEELADELK